MDRPDHSAKQACSRQARSNSTKRSVAILAQGKSPSLCSPGIHCKPPLWGGVVLVALDIDVTIRSALRPRGRPMRGQLEPRGPGSALEEPRHPQRRSSPALPGTRASTTTPLQRRRAVRHAIGSHTQPPAATSPLAQLVDAPSPVAPDVSDTLILDGAPQLGQAVARPHSLVSHLPTTFEELHPSRRRTRRPLLLCQVRASGGGLPAFPRTVNFQTLPRHIDLGQPRQLPCRPILKLGEASPLRSHDRRGLPLIARPQAQQDEHPHPH